ncbi:MAG: ribosome silencing factor [Sphingobacteriales bacterium]|nr:MAG: ribosome silencing factor [Sphingobacteriales bacterium]
MTKKAIVDDNLAQLTNAIVEAMQDKKAKNIVALDLRRLNNRVVDKFIICHAENDRQVEAIAKNVEDHVKENLQDKPWHKEGYENKEWILLDYVNIVVHVFLDEKRDFYAIEELWGDAETEKFKDVA